MKRFFLVSPDSITHYLSANWLLLMLFFFMNRFHRSRCITINILRQTRRCSFFQSHFHPPLHFQSLFIYHMFIFDDTDFIFVLSAAISAYVYLCYLFSPRSNTRNFALFARGFSSVSLWVGTIGLRVTTLPFLRLPHTHTGNSGGH